MTRNTNEHDESIVEEQPWADWVASVPFPSEDLPRLNTSAEADEELGALIGERSPIAWDPWDLTDVEEVRPFVPHVGTIGQGKAILQRLAIYKAFKEATL